MPKTEVRSGQILNATVGRSDINIATPGEAIVGKIVAGTGISLSSTGADTGTGDVTITAAGGGAPAAHQATHQIGGSDVLLNAAWTNQANIFTQDQNVNKTNPVISVGNVTRGRIFQKAGQGDVNISNNLSWDGANYNSDNSSNPSTLMVGTNAEIFFLSCPAGTNPRTSSVQQLAKMSPTGLTTIKQEIQDSVYPSLTLNQTGAAADQKKFELSIWNSSFYLTAKNDNGSDATVPITATRSGDVTIGRNLNVTGSGGNVALKNVSNQFTQAQGIVMPSVAELDLMDTGQPANYKIVRIMNLSQTFAVWMADDGYSGVQAITFDRAGAFRNSGHYYEYGRTTPMGNWIEFTPGMAATGGPMTIDANYASRYMLVGKTLTIIIYLSITLAATSIIHFTIPGGMATTGYSAIPFCVGAGYGMWQGTPGSYTTFMYQAVNGTALPAGSYAIAGTAVFSVY